MLARDDILAWLHEPDEPALAELWRLADDARRRFVGDEVHLRGLIEFCNCCRRSCAYCGLRADNAAIRRYRMTAQEILACAGQAVQFGYGSVVLQSGEDPAMDVAWLAEVVRQIKRQTPLAVTLSVGERNEEDYAAWRQAGADRYLLRFETSNRRLYEQIHPSLPGRRSDRIELLRKLRGLGYEVGSGVMVGIPGQTYDDLADDIELFARLDLDMIGLGPFIPHPATPLGVADKMGSVPIYQIGTHPIFDAQQRELLTYKMLALARLGCPRANIPSTTALATLNLSSGRELGLQRGANVVMPNLTPPAYRALYEIYPAKACIRETAQQCQACLGARIAAIGRRIGTGRGDSPDAARRATMGALE